MKCEEVSAVMIDYLDRSIEASLVNEIDKHLETCERCIDELRDYQEVMKLMNCDKMIEPGEALRANFNNMLHNEIEKMRKVSVAEAQLSVTHWYSSSIFRIAAGFAILMLGTFMGLFMGSQFINKSQSGELAQLKSEVSDLKRSAMMTMLKDESSSFRIQAVNYADEIETPDDNMIGALARTLNTDKNVNVRMAAAYALAKFAGSSPVNDTLVRALANQSDPIVQITLINILVDLKEKSAVKTIQEIISDENTLKEVKSVAENGVKVLL